MDPKVITLSRFRSDISRSLQKQAKQLLLSKDIAAQVAALQPLELYYLIKEVGIDDGFPLVLHASPEQFQACIDLDCWQGDTLSIIELDAWLAPFAAGGTEALAEAFFKLEEELQTLYIASTLTIWEASDETIPESPEDVPRATTIDNFFIVECKPIELELDPFALVNAIYRHNIEESYRLMVAARFESYSATEEACYGFRSGRMEDLGFPAPEVAASLFAKPKTLSADTTFGVKTKLPAIYAHALVDESLFVQAAGLVGDAHVVERVEHELLNLINTAMVAYGESPRDLQHAAFVAERVRDTLSLGLEKLVERRDAAAAAEALGQLPLFEIFKHGQQILLGLHAQAKSYIEKLNPWLNAGASDDDDETRADKYFVNALLNLRGVVHAGYDLLDARKQKAFATFAEIKQAAERLLGIVASR
jgi:hypothetical protein